MARAAAEALEGRVLLSLSAQISGPPTIGEGGTYTLNLFASGTDAGSVNRWDIDWGDGSDPDANGTPGESVAGGSTASATHVFAPGIASARVTAFATTTGGVTSNTASLGLDPSFGSGGVVTTPFGLGGSAVAYAMALQPDGKLVLAGTGDGGGDFALARYNADGSPDDGSAADTTPADSFGSGGKVTIDFHGSSDSAYGVAVQADGKIVAAGAATLADGFTTAFGLARLNPDGTLDAGFDADGRVTTAFGEGWDQAFAMAIQGDGKIVAAGLVTVGGENVFGAARYNLDGTPDSSFDADGRASIRVNGYEYAQALAVQPDGMLVLGGWTWSGTDYDFGIARLTAAGAPDITFSGDGAVSTDFSANRADYGFGLALQDDDKIVAAGHSDANGGFDEFALARYLSDGSLDVTFDLDGKVLTGFGTSAGAKGVAVQPDGKILAAGYAGGRAALARYEPDGRPDITFGLGGQFTPDVASGAAAGLYALALRPDGRFVAGGYTGGGSFLAAQFQRDNRVGVIPAAPTALSVTPTTSSSEMTLAWIDNSRVETQFEVDRALDVAFTQDLSTFTVPAVAGSQVTHTDTGLVGGTTYHYRVRAQSAAGASDYSNVAGAPAFSAYAMGVVADSPLGYWRLGETGGTTATDASGNGRQGAYMGGVTLATPGAIFQDADTAASFDGADDQVTVPDSAALRLTGDLALEAWVYRSEVQSDWVRVIGEGGWTQRNYGLWIEPGVTAARVMYQKYDGTNSLNVYSSATLGLNTWHHVAATVEASTVRVYVDGVLSGTGTRTVAPPTSADPLTIGYAGYHAFFKGRIDEAAVYGRSLTSLQVQSRYEVGGGTLTAPTGLGVFGDAWIDGISFTWQDNSASEDFYLVEWSDGTEWHVIDELPAGSMSYTDDYPVIGKDNQYRVAAGRGPYVDELVISSPSNTISAYPKAPAVAWYDDNGGPNDRDTLAPYATVHDRPVTFSVLPNDADYDGGSFHITRFTQPANGTVVQNADGGFTYTPAAKFVGADKFTYHITDGTLESAEATVAIDVTNAAPVAERRRYEFNLWKEVVRNDVKYYGKVEGGLAASDADGDALTYKVVRLPDHGTLEEFNPATGQFLYTAGSAFAGVDSFHFVANDGVEDGPAAQAVIVSHTEIAYPNWVEQINPGETYVGVPGPDDYTGILPGHEVQHGQLWGHSDMPDGGPPYTYFGYTAHETYTGDDSFKYARHWGAVTQKPRTVVFHIVSPDTPYSDNWWGDRYGGPHIPRTYFRVYNTETTVISPDVTEWLFNGFAGSIAMGQLPTHGTIDWTGLGGFSYTPEPDPQTGGPYYGWDFFSITVTQPWGGVMEQWVQLDVGDYVPPTTPRPESQWQPQNFPPSLQGLHDGYQACKSLLNGLMGELSALGQKVGPVGDAEADAILDRLDEASAHINPAAAKYDQYLAQLTQLNHAAGQFLADQWFVSQDDYDVLMAIQGLPLTVGSLTPSRDKMEALAGSLEALGRGADVAIDTANKIVTFAEDTKKVLDAAQMVGGGTVLLTTGARLLVQEGIKACAKEAAKQLVVATASAVAAQMAGYGARLLGLSEEQQRWVQIGLDAFQIFAFMKAARARARMDGECFAAGTQVITGIAADGSLITKSIEDVRVGDRVVSRDQHDATDDLDARRVTQVFRKTSDHLRVLTIQDADGNVETIRTTDEHPFHVSGRGWTAAGDLTAGARLTEANGTDDAVVVASVREEHPGGINVFNFEVAGDHTYFVDDGLDADVTALWVHNTCRTPREARNVAIKHKDTARRDLRSDAVANQGESAVEGMDAHHLIPLSLAGDRSVARIIGLAAKGGWNYNRMGDNGVLLSAGHGPHSEYTAWIRESIRQNQKGITTPAQAKQLLDEIVAEARTPANLELWFGA